VLLSVCVVHDCQSRMALWYFVSLSLVMIWAVDVPFTSIYQKTMPMGIFRCLPWILNWAAMQLM